MHEINPVSSLDPTEALRWRTGGEMAEEERAETVAALPAYQALDVSPIGLEASPDAGRRVLTAQVGMARELMRDTSSDELMSLNLTRDDTPRPAPLLTNLNADDFMTNQVGGQQGAPAKPPQSQQPPKPAQRPARPSEPKKVGSDKPPRPDKDFLENPKFKALSPDQQEIVKNLMTKVGNRDEFYALLESGKLTLRDTKGKMLLDHLLHIGEHQVLATGVNRQEILDTLIAHLVQPENIMQGGRNTCAATAIQYKLARANPAEYARLVTGLIDDREDRVQLQGGGYLVRKNDSIADDGSRRTQLDRIMQSSLMERGAQSSAPGVPPDYKTRSGKLWKDLDPAEQARVWRDEMTPEEWERFGRKLGPDGTYDNRDDKVRYRRGGRVGEFQGMGSDGIQDTENDVLGGNRKDHTYRDSPDARREFEEKLKRQYVGMLVSLRWSRSGAHEHHALVVDGISNGQVHLYNPQGAESTYKSGLGGIRDGPRVQNTGMARVSMSIDEFFSRLESYNAE